MMNTVLIIAATFTVGVAAGALLTFTQMKRVITRRLQADLDRKIIELERMPACLTDTRDAIFHVNKIEDYIRKQYRYKLLSCSIPYDMPDESIIGLRIFLRWIHGAGCVLNIKDAARHDVEQDSQATNLALGLTTKLCNSRYEHSIDRTMGVG